MFRAVFLLAAIIGTTAFRGYHRRHSSKIRCNPPSSLKARVELIGLDNDRDFDGFVTNKDLEIDLINYDKDGDLTQTFEKEVVDHWKCRYGFAEDFIKYFYNLLDSNGDGVWTGDDFAGPFVVSGEMFRQMQIVRFRGYCETKKYTATDCEKLNQETNLDSFGNFSLPLVYYPN